MAKDYDTVKPLFWVATSRRDLKRLASPVRAVFGFALWQAQNGEKHPDAKPLRGFGDAGVLEVIAEELRSTYRAVYTVRFPEAVYVLHAFQKKSRRGIKTPQTDIETILARLKAAEEHYHAWQAARKQGPRK